MTAAQDDPNAALARAAAHLDRATEAVARARAELLA